MRSAELRKISTNPRCPDAAEKKMKWSKVKKLVEDSFADSVRGRVRICSTWYQCRCGRGWITIDGKEIVDLSTHAAWQKYDAVYHESTKTAWRKHPSVPDEQRTPGHLAEKGEFSRFDLHEACWEYLHSNVHQALSSDNPLLVSLAVLNAKVGKTRLVQLAQEKLHPLSHALLLFRMQAEGLSRPAASDGGSGESGKG